MAEAYGRRVQGRGRVVGEENWWWVMDDGCRMTESFDACYDIIRGVMICFRTIYLA